MTAEGVLRSVLFVPASRPAWVADLDRYGADAVILDLEDSVPEEGKSAARDLVTETLLGATHSTTVFVRVNGPTTGRMVDDLRAAVAGGVSGVCVPKIITPADLNGVDTVLHDAELQAGVSVGRTGVLLIPETAPALRDLDALAQDRRVRWVAGVSGRDGDVARSVGFEWSVEGLESLMLQSKVVLDARAAGVEHPIAGLWQDVHDLAGFERRARHHRALGFAGELLLHPGQVPAAHRVYTPSAKRLDHYRGLVDAVERGRREGRSSVVYAGEHVDEAHLQTASAFLARWDRGRT